MIRLLWLLYGLMYLIAAGLFAASGSLIAPQHILVAVSLLICWKRRTLRAWLHRMPAPAWLKYALLGTFYSVLIGESLGVNLQGDLHANLLINSFLWLGSYAGILAAWWLLARRYTWTPGQVFALCGLLGVQIEQDFLITRMLLGGQVIEALLAAVFIHAIYAALFTPAVLVGIEPPARELPAPGLIAKGLAIFGPMILFYIGSLWIFAWLPAFTG